MTPLELLESRELLTASAEHFTGPNLAPLLKRHNTGPAIITTMTKALQTQLTAGPLADLKAGKVGAADYVLEVQNVVASYIAYSDSHLAKLPNTKESVNLQGFRAAADAVSLGTQNANSLISNAALPASAASSIKSLTAGPIKPVNTPAPNLNYFTSQFVMQVDTLIADFGTGKLTLSNLSTVLVAEAEAYRTAIHAGILVNHPIQSNVIDGYTINLENAVENIAATNGKLVAGQLIGSINLFYNNALDYVGTFAPKGPIGNALRAHGWPATPTILADDTTLSDVSATGILSGTTTYSATLTDNTSGQPAPNESVTFTLAGTYIDTVVTDNNGLATITLPTTATAPGTTTGLVATFAGDVYHRPTTAFGSQVVNKLATALSAVSGTANFGGTATVMATLKNSNTNTSLSGQTVNFSLDGKPLGSGVTNSSGVATFTGGTITSNPSTDTGGIVATYDGNATNAAATASGNLVISQTNTALSVIGGTATFGQTATLTATLKTSSGTPIAGQSIDFTLGTQTASAKTDSNGVATVTGITTSAGAGTVNGAVTANFTGTTGYGSAIATGNLVVSQATTSLSAVSGSGTFGNTATLNATLSSGSTPVVGQTVLFQINGTNVGSAVTGTNGVATLTNVTNTVNAGTPATITAIFSPGAGSNYAAAANATGNLVIAKAETAISGVSGTATGNLATLFASLLTSGTSKAGIGGETVSFILDGTPVGTAVTNGSGLATLTNVATNDPAGVHTGAVVVEYVGGTNYLAASNGTGDLTVS